MSGWAIDRLCLASSSEFYKESSRGRFTDDLMTILRQILRSSFTCLKTF